MTIELLDEPEVASEVVDRAELAGGAPLVQYSRTEAALAELKARHAGATFDLATTAGDKAARAARLELVTLRTTLEKTRKGFKEPALEFGRMIDAEAKRITVEILALEEPIDRQIKADEQRRATEKAERERIEAERIAGHEAGLAKIRSYVASAAGLPAARITVGIDRLEAWSQAFDPATWEEFADSASTALTETHAALVDMRAKAQAREDEAARVDAQRVENERVQAEIAAQRKELADAAEALRLRQEAQSQRDAADAHAAAAMAAPQPTPPAEPVNDCAGTVPVPEMAGGAARLPAPSTPSPAHSVIPTLTVSEINRRLGFQVNAAFLSSIGFDAAALRSSKLYYSADWPAICRAIAMHVGGLA